MKCLLVAIIAFVVATAESNPKYSEKEDLTEPLGHGFIIHLAMDTVHNHKEEKSLSIPTTSKGRLDFKHVNAKTLEIRLKERNEATVMSALGLKHNKDTGLVIQSWARLVSAVHVDISEEQAKKLRESPLVTSVDRVKLHQIQTTHTYDWMSMPSIWGSEVHDISESLYNAAGAGIVVAIVDTGINPSHESFSNDFLMSNNAALKTVTSFTGACEPGTDNTMDVALCGNKLVGCKVTFVPPAGESQSCIDDHGHGTHVAGTSIGNYGAMGDNNQIMSGMAPLASFAVYKVCGTEGCPTTAIISAAEEAVADGCDLLSMSISGGKDLTTGYSPAMRAAGEAGMFLAMAGGNDGSTAATVTKSAPWYTSVAAGTHPGGTTANPPTVASFSSRGPSNYKGFLKPDILAPGVSVTAAWIGGDSAVNSISGTSMATPHVSGIAAIIKEVHPDWSPVAIKSAMMTSAYRIRSDGTPIPGNPYDFGSGHISPVDALDVPLVYDYPLSDYRRVACSETSSLCASGETPLAPSDLNLPSVSLIDNSNPVERTVTNVKDFPVSVNVIVTPDNACSVTVQPSSFQISAGSQQTFTVQSVGVCTGGPFFPSYELQVTPALIFAKDEKQGQDLVWTVYSPVVASVCLTWTPPNISCGETVSGDTSGACNTYGNIAGDHRYLFSVSESTSVSIDTCDSGYDSYLHLVDSAGNIVSFNDDSCTGLSSRLVADVPPGDYVIVVDGFSSHEGTYDLTVQCNGNFTTPTATPAPECIPWIPQDIGCDTDISGDTSRSCSMYGNSAGDHEYTFSVYQETDISIDTCGASYDSYLWLVDNSNGNLVVGDDDSCTGLSSLINTTIPAGSYSIFVDGYSSHEGAYDVRLRCSDSGSPPKELCYDHDEVVAYFASLYGMELSSEYACMMIGQAPYDGDMEHIVTQKQDGNMCTDSVYGPLVQLLCPVSCGVTDDDDSIGYLASMYLEAPYNEMITSCADAIEVMGCDDDTYGSFIREYCPCSCNSDIMYWIGVGGSDDGASQ